MVSDLIVRHAGGLLLGEGSIVRDCVFDFASSSNVLRPGSIISESVVKHSTGFQAIFVSGASVITRNALYENEGDGIGSAGETSGSVILGNSSYRNGGTGAGGNSNNGLSHVTIANNTIYGNGTDVGEVFRDGIVASWSLVVGNTIHGNAESGLSGFLSGYRENVISDNPGGTVTGLTGHGMTDLGGNLCNGVASCP